MAIKPYPLRGVSYIDHMVSLCSIIHQLFGHIIQMIIQNHLNKHEDNTLYMDSFTSGRSEGEGRSPRDLADLTELRIFSPTLDKSMPPPWKIKKGSKKKTRELSNPSSLKSSKPLLFNINGFP